VVDRGVQWAQRHFESVPVVYIPGNHEYYHYHIGVLQRRLRTRATNTNVTILDNDSVVMGNYQLYCATLWTAWALDGSPAASAKFAQRNINDFTLIRTGEEGKAAPAFTLEDEFGAKVSLKDFRGSHVIVYFYPKDDTPGCTKEAYAFRDHWIDFNDEDAVIIGISPDDQTSQTVSHKTHAQFSVAQRPGEESNDQVRGIRGKDSWCHSINSVDRP